MLGWGKYEKKKSHLSFQKSSMDIRNGKDMEPT